MDNLKSVDTRKFYKVFYVTSGPSAININDRLFMLEAGDIFFFCPGDRLSFQVGKNGKAYLCLIHTEYLSADSKYLLDLFTHFPFCIIHRAVVALDNRQAEIVSFCFENMLDEQKSSNPDQKQATVLHLQMILLQIQRAGQKHKCLDAFNTSQLFSCS